MATDEHPTLGHGKVCYLQIPATDIARSAAFYQNVFGWRVRTRANGHIAFDDGVGQVSGEWVLGWPTAATPGRVQDKIVTPPQIPVLFCLKVSSS